MDGRRLLLIVNPAGGRGRTLEVLPSLVEELEALGVEHEVRRTAAPGEATNLAEEAGSDGFTHAVAVGGDGTVHEVVNGLVDADDGVGLGVVPSGSGNDLARTLGIPRDAAAAARVFAEGRSVPLDVGRLGPRVFANGFGLGLDGAVAHRYESQVRFTGGLGYLVAAFREALGFDAFPLEVETPSGVREGPTLLAGACNGPTQGGDFRIAPGADPSDGLLDVYAVEELGVLRRLWNLPRVRRGVHEDLPEFHREQVPWVTFRTGAPVPAHMDGEVLQLRPGSYRVEVVPGAVRVLVP